MHEVEMVLREIMSVKALFADDRNFGSTNNSPSVVSCRHLMRIIYL
jgi:hypothetical protein